MEVLGQTRGQKARSIINFHPFKIPHDYVRRAICKGSNDDNRPGPPDSQIPILQL